MVVLSVDMCVCEGGEEKRCDEVGGGPVEKPKHEGRAGQRARRQPMRDSATVTTHPKVGPWL